MQRLDFGRLRAEVEEATRLPEFEVIRRRARWFKLRSRCTTAAAALTAIAILLPAGVLAARGRGVVVAPVDAGPGDSTISPSPAQVFGPTRTTLVAADGTDMNHLYALVDACATAAGTHPAVIACSLQLARLTANTHDDSTGPLRIGLLRSQSTDQLDHVGLVALDQYTVVVSGQIGTDTSVVPVYLGPNPTKARSGTAVAPGDRLVQLDQYGTLQALHSPTESMVQLPQQPALDRRTVVSGITPTDGFWVVGVAAGQLGVAVSHDGGASWTTRPLGVPAVGAKTVLASEDGTTAYLFTRADDGTFLLFRTADSGQDWTQLGSAVPWVRTVASTADYGLVVRPDGSLLAWLATPKSLSYLQSRDAGATFMVTGGPGGKVVAVPGGYICLGSNPRLSTDGVTWTAARAPSLPVTG